MPMLYVSLGALAVVLALFSFTAHDKIAAAVTLTLVGALGFATVPPLQEGVLDQAHGAPTLASAVNIGAFNLGNALAAWLGGLVIHAGLGYTAPNRVGAALAVSARVLAFVAAALERGESAVGTAPDLRERTLGRHLPTFDSRRDEAAEYRPQPAATVSGA